jgi:predicted nucleotidyltransferase
MVIHRVLDEVFRSWSNVAVLRALIDTASGFTGNEAARLSGMHPRSALKALTILEELGIVHRQRGGRDHLFTLNRENYLVQNAILPLYRIEQKFKEVLLKEITLKLKNHVLSIVMFGSTARKEENPRSDLDICLIVKTPGEKNTVREVLNSIVNSLNKKYGIKVAPVFFTLDEIRKKKKSLLVKDIINEGEVIFGKNPKVFLNG